MILIRGKAHKVPSLIIISDVNINQNKEVCMVCINPKRVKVVVCGGRDFTDYDFLKKKLDSFRLWLQENHDEDVGLIIDGKAAGADTLANDYAKERGVLWARYAADWKSYGKSAGMMRNRIMLDQEPDYVVGFFGGVGTAGMIAISKAAGVSTFHIKG